MNWTTRHIYWRQSHVTVWSNRGGRDLFAFRTITRLRLNYNRDYLNTDSTTILESIGIGRLVDRDRVRRFYGSLR